MSVSWNWYQHFMLTWCFLFQVIISWISCYHGNIFWKMNYFKMLHVNIMELVSTPQVCMVLFIPRQLILEKDVAMATDFEKWITSKCFMSVSWNWRQLLKLSMVLFIPCQLMSGKSCCHGNIFRKMIYFKMLHVSIMELVSTTSSVHGAFYSMSINSGKSCCHGNIFRKMIYFKMFHVSIMELVLTPQAVHGAFYSTSI